MQILLSFEINHFHNLRKFKVLNFEKKDLYIF